MVSVDSRPASIVLHRTFGEDRVMHVYFNEFPTEDKFQLVRDGIVVGLRQYRFWTLKDSGKEDFKIRTKPYAKDYQRVVMCFFVCTESLADVDLADPNFKYFTRIEAARCHIMHIHTVPTLPKFASWMWEEAVNETFFTENAAFVKCPGCDMVFEKMMGVLPPKVALTRVPELDTTMPFIELQNEGKRLSRSAMCHKATNQFRCRLCTIDFCGACKEFLYHLGRSCEEEAEV